MPNSQPSSIVVGVDGSAAGQAALRFAIREANVRGSAVDVVTTWQGSIPPGAALFEEATEARLHAHQLQEDMIRTALGQENAPRLISRHVISGDAGPALVQLSRSAAYLVVGSQGKGAFQRAVLGSVSQYCVRHSDCPVVVVPEVIRAHSDLPYEMQDEAFDHTSLRVSRSLS